jgi:hypothetical protein
MFTILLSSQQALAVKQTCDETLGQCLIVDHEAEKVIDLQVQHINKLKDENSQLQEALDAEMAKEAHDEAWYRDPKFTVPMAFIIGALAGVYAAHK